MPVAAWIARKEMSKACWDWEHMDWHSRDESDYVCIRDLLCLVSKMTAVRYLYDTRP